jgi:hypothetical protein
MTRSISNAALMSVCLALGGCGYGVYEYPSAEYLHRTDTITTSAGNAQAINEVTQVIKPNPWDKSAHNRRIRGNGDRAVNAVERYRAKQSSSGSQISQPAGSAPPGGNYSASPPAGGASSTTGGGAGGPGPMQ